MFPQLMLPSAISESIVHIDFIFKTLPHIMLAIMVVYIVFFICRDRYRRGIALRPSLEERKIDNLCGEGAISDEEASRLRASCHSLPEPEETTPVPDLPLRAAAGYTQLFAWMYLTIFLALGIYMCYANYLKTRNIPGVTVDLGDLRRLWPGLTIIAAFSILSIGQAIAARLLLRGRLGARAYIFAVWLIYLATAGFIGNSYGSWLFAAVEILLGFWILRVLYFRKGATAKIATGRSDPGTGRKAAMFALMLAAVAAAPFCASSATGDPLQKTFTQIGCATGSPAARICKIYLIAGTQDTAVKKVTEQLAEIVRTQTGIPCEAVPFGGAVLNAEMNRELALMISLGDGVIPGGKMKLKPDWNSSSAKSLPSEIEIAIQGPQALEAFRGKPTFEIMTLLPFAGRSQMYKGLCFPEIMFKAHGTSASDSADPEACSEKAVAEIAKTLVPQLKKAVGSDSIPVPKLNETIAPAPGIDLSKLKNPRLIFSGCGSTLAAFYVYTFEKNGYEADLEAAKAALKPIGANMEGKSGGDALLFRSQPDRGVEAELYIGPASDSLALAGQVVPELKYGTLIVSVKRANNIEHDENFSEKVASEDLRTFVRCRGLRFIKDSNRRLDILNRFFALEPLGWSERYSALDSMALPMSAPELELFRLEYAKLLKETGNGGENAQSEIRQLRDLARSEDNASLELFMREMAQYISKIPIPIAEATDWRSMERVFHSENGNLRRMICLEFDDKSLLPLWIDAEIGVDGQVRLFTGSFGSNDRPMDGKTKIFYDTEWNIIKSARPPYKLNNCGRGGPAYTDCMWRNGNLPQSRPETKFESDIVLAAKFEFDIAQKSLQMTVYYRRLPAAEAK